MGDSSLTPAFTYFYIAHDAWGEATRFVKEDAQHHLHYVPEGASVYDIAGKAGSWLGRTGNTLTGLVIVAHGSPGRFVLGKEVTADNAGALGGWLQSFFEDPSNGIKVFGCNSAADSTTKINGSTYGQANRLEWKGVSHQGYELLLSLAKASGQVVEGALHAQAIADMKLINTCRRVFPDGRLQTFVGTK